MNLRRVSAAGILLDRDWPPARLAAGELHRAPCRPFSEPLQTTGGQEMRTEADASVLGISRRCVIRYVYGTQDVPESVRRLIVMMIKHGIPKE